jgi:hypothetical protein
MHPAQAQGGKVEATARPSQARLVRDLVETLPEAQRRLAGMPFEGAERMNWHYIPRQRAGLPIAAMGAETREALERLLRGALSEAGYEKVKGILAIERILGQIEGRPSLRDPENYSLSVFGEVGRGPWGWRLEGHHLSLNVTLRDDQAVAVVPVFLGANPARVPDGYAMAGHRVLGRETDLAYALIRGLEGPARERAVIATTSLGNIVAGPGREQLVSEREGLPLGAMPDGLRDLALELLQAWVGAFHPEIAERELARVREAGLHELHFAWGGPLEAGHAHYWRLHGPITLLEFDNTQNDANHIHSVWHDLVRNFGRDLLREHYQHGHRHDHT